MQSKRIHRLPPVLISPGSYLNQIHQIWQNMPAVAGTIRIYSDYRDNICISIPHRGGPATLALNVVIELNPLTKSLAGILSINHSPAWFPAAAEPAGAK